MLRAAPQLQPTKLTPPSEVRPAAKRRVVRGLAALAIVAIAALAVRIPYLAQRSVWYDEASSWHLANLSLRDMMDALTRNVHMPLYYLVLKGWMGIWGDSATALRGLSALLGVVSAVGMYFLAREVRPRLPDSDRDGRGVPLYAGLLVALSAFQVNASIETRMYALGVALTVAAAFSLWKVLASPVGRFWWGAWSLLCIALAYTHHHCLLVAASQFCFAWGYAAFASHLDRSTRRRVALRTAIAAAVVALAYVPGMLLLSRQLARVRQDYWTEPLSLSLVSGTFVEFLSPLLKDSQIADFIGPLVFLLLCLAALVLMLRPRTSSIFALMLGWLPLILAAIATLAVTPVWEGRFFRFAQPFLLLSFALAVFQLPLSRTMRLCCVTATLVGVGAATFAFWIDRDVPHRPGMKGAIDRIAAESSRGDLVLSTSNIHYLPASYYAGDDLNVRMLESGTDGFWTDSVITASDIASEDEIEAGLRRGAWVLSHSPIPAGASELEGVVVDKYFVMKYDNGVPQWDVHVSRVRKLASRSASAGP